MSAFAFLAKWFLFWRFYKSPPEHSFFQMHWGPNFGCQDLGKSLSDFHSPSPSLPTNVNLRMGPLSPSLNHLGSWPLFPSSLHSHPLNSLSPLLGAPAHWMNRLMLSCVRGSELKGWPGHQDVFNCLLDTLSLPLWGRFYWLHLWRF